jgi:hypothetical protein
MGTRQLGPKVQEVLAELHGQPLSGTTNILATRWFLFGEPHLGTEQQVAPYILSIECAWRIERAGRVVVGSADFELEAERRERPPGVQVDWNLQNEKLLEFFGDHRQGYIVSRSERVVHGLETDEMGGCILMFGDGYRLGIFPCSSTLEEWGLLRRPGEGRFSITNSNWTDTRLGEAE